MREKVNETEKRNNKEYQILPVFWKDCKNRQTTGKSEQGKKISSTNNFRTEKGDISTDIVEI